MNTNFLAIIKRIIAEQGEGILSDPQRIKPFIKDYAQNVPQEERRAFGRCIEQGFYRQIQAAHTAEERRRLKNALAGQLQGAAGISPALCSGALDLLDAAVPLSPAPVTPAPGAASVMLPAMPRITKRTLIFGAAAGAGALVGYIIGALLILGIPDKYAIRRMALLLGTVSIGVSLALIAAQHILQRKQPDFKSLLPPVLLGVITGAAAGGIAQAIFNVTQNISPFVRATSNALCWGFFGAGLGLGVSLFIPNYPKKRAVLAGLLGGTLGGAIYVALLSSGTDAGGIIGVIVLGLAIGSAISFIEEALREAWLTVFWGPKESRAISLGAKPVVFGSSREADVYVPSRHGDVSVPPVRAVFTIENGAVVMEDKQTGRRGVLPNGGEVMIDRLRVVVNTKS